MTGETYFWDLLHNTTSFHHEFAFGFTPNLNECTVVENTENVLPVEIGMEYVPNPDSDKGPKHFVKKFMGSIVLFNYEEEDKGPKLLGQEGKDSFEIIFKEIQNELNMIESKKGTFALFLDYTSMDSNAYSDNRSSILHTVNPNFVNNTTQISEEARREFWKTSSTCVNICLGKISSDQPLQLARYRSRKYEKGYQKRIW